MALPISVTYTFATATSAIPLSQLDANFTTVVNGINGIGNGTNSLSNVSITGGNVAVTTANATTINATTLNAATHRSDTSLTFQSNGTTTAMTINTSQSVGVGMTVYNNKLNVNGSSGVYFDPVGYPNMRGYVLHNGNTGGFNVVAQGVNNSTFGAGDITFYTPDTNSANGSTDASVSEKMRITYNGNVGIGTSSPAYRLDVKGNTGTGIAYNDGTVINYLGTTGSNLGYLGTLTNYPVAFLTNATERARIDTSGNLLVGAATQFSGFVANAKLYTQTGTGDYIAHFRNANGTAGSNYGVAITYSTAPNTNTNNFLDLRDSSAQRFAVYSNGGIANYSANNTNLSDQRLKKDIQLSGSYLDKICAIPVKTFLYKDQTDDDLNLGVIAQEVEAVAPELVDAGGFGETPEDGVPYKTIYQTDLQYALMKCIQELKAQNDELKARVAALETK